MSTNIEKRIIIIIRWPNKKFKSRVENFNRVFSKKISLTQYFAKGKVKRKKMAGRGMGDEEWERIYSLNAMSRFEILIKNTHKSILKKFKDHQITF